ncbi:DegV family protein [Nonomuraea sp. PA05]|uniref:DegV family protein n=1 Tax=Nonomuraea sp. PA05 TaxID=2604466 RepID=UPI0021CCA6D3|nr:DegV family protein [Nonomuraea sp. PA05]
MPVQVVGHDLTSGAEETRRGDFTSGTRESSRGDFTSGTEGSSRGSSTSGIEGSSRGSSTSGGRISPRDRLSRFGRTPPGNRTSHHPPGSFSSDLAFDEDSFTGDLASATTSRPAPARFAACYSALAAGGATAIVSIHVSGELSGTIESALTAARDAPVPVEVIDSRSIAMGLGYPVLAAARAAATGASLDEVVTAARASMRTTRTFFYVDTLDYLHRSGRIGTAASLLGSALMIKPLLHLADGRICLLEKVRTSSRAIARLEDLAVQAAGKGAVEVAVQHLAARERAEALAERLHKRVPDLRDLRVVEVGAVIGVHVGPGMLGLTITSSDA